MPQRQRPSLSAPSYGSLTGRINWSRGMDEQLAQAPNIVAPPVQPAAAPAALAPVTTRRTTGNFAGSGDRYLPRLDLIQ